MIYFADKKTLLQDRYQALILPVATSGIHKHRLLLRLQGLYPEQYQFYKRACETGEFHQGEVLLYETQRDLAGLGVGGALSKPKFIVSLGVTDHSEHPIPLGFVKQAFVQLEPILMRWGRYEGIRRVAVLAPDELILPNEKNFEDDILPLMEKYLNPIDSMSIVVYR